jgi:hypothetical protein
LVTTTYPYRYRNNNEMVSQTSFVQGYK